MAILINHKFLDRLSTHDTNRKINCLIIGTFNPGHPDETQLNETEKCQFKEIKQSVKYKEFSKILNFYDRSKNRFWKVMDVLLNESYYNSDFERINPEGLKFYKAKTNMNRKETFDRQKEFCKNQEIFITDLVKSIKPVSFCNIYENFPDTTLEKSYPEWNTSEIKEMIKIYSIKNILVNFNYESKSTSGLNAQIREIKEIPAVKVSRVMSPSGAAGNSYADLVADWKKHIVIKK